MHKELKTSEDLSVHNIPSEVFEDCRVPADHLVGNLNGATICMVTS